MQDWPTLTDDIIAIRIEGQMRAPVVIVVHCEALERFRFFCQDTVQVMHQIEIRFRYP